MREVLFLPFLLLLAGCSSAAATLQPTVAKAPPVAYADKESSPAKGTKTCHVRQLESAHLDQLRAGEQAKFGMSTQPYISELFAKVWPDGSVGLAVNEDTYPGTDAYFLVGGKRYSGDGDGYVKVPASAAGGVVQYTYTSWPYRSEISREDAFGGWEAAYQECLAFLRA